MDSVIVELPPNLARYLATYFCIVRYSYYGPAIGLRPGEVPTPKLLPAQAKFLADVAHALHNITGAGLVPGTYANGAAYFFAQAKVINASWRDHEDLLRQDPRNGVADLFPLPEEAKA